MLCLSALIKPYQGAHTLNLSHFLRRFLKENKNRRFLNCPGMAKIAQLKKFVAKKYGLNETFVVDIIYKEEIIPEEFTLIDVAYHYHWKKVRESRNLYA